MKAAFVLLATALGLAQASDKNKMLVRFDSLGRRQAFDPGETTGSGANCVEAFGEGYVECRPASDTKNRLCINPSLGETCCNNLWGCPADSFCLVQDLCCPTGLDPKTCAAQNSVTLPAGFTVPTAPAVPSTTPPAVTSVGSSIPVPGYTYTPTTTKAPVHTAGAAQDRAGVAAAVIGFAAALVI